MVPGTAVGGLVAAAIALPLADPLSPQGIDIFWIGLLGLVVIPIAFGLITTGPRYLPAPEVGLIMLLETVLGPIWVWIALGEEPPPMSLVGGAIVIVALAVHSLVRLRQQQAARRARPGAITHVGPVTTDPGDGEEGR